MRNLGVHIDGLLDMHVHITKTAQACFFQLLRLRRVRRLLGRDVTANLVAALVFTRLDYGNVLLAGLPYSSVAPHQRVINVAVNLVKCQRSATMMTMSLKRRSICTGYRQKHVCDINFAYW